MGYRELSRMEIVEVVRRWQAGESQRGIARATGLARETVSKYLAAAGTLGLLANGPPPNEKQVVALVRVGSVVGAPRTWAAPGRDALEPHAERIRRWVQHDELQLTRVQELLARDGVRCSYMTLLRFVRRAGWSSRPRSTVRVAESEAGEVAEIDYGRMGMLLNPLTGKWQAIWALVVVLPFSRHCFVWLTTRQTLDATIEGLEAAWVVLDNFPAAIAGPDALEPRPTRGFLEYSQARGFLLDPARVRHPKDKPHVERTVRYVRERFWKGSRFRDLADAQRQAQAWCIEVAGRRVHGSTGYVPLIVFEERERAHLLPIGDEPYDVPVWRTVTVHPDHHISFQNALYSAPSSTCPPGTHLEVRGDRAVVNLYRRGELIKSHFRQPRGGRATDPTHYPAHLTAYALRSPDRLVRQAARLGPNVHTYAMRLLEGPLPWAKLRQVQKLLRLGERYTAERLEAACARSLAYELVDVRRLERIIVLAIEGDPAVDEPLSAAQALPSRFARPGSAFDHRFSLPTASAAVEVLA
jgi:transposase